MAIVIKVSVDAVDVVVAVEVVGITVLTAWYAEGLWRKEVGQVRYIG